MPTSPALPQVLASRSDSIYAVTVPAVVIDTNVFVSALRSGDGASRQVIRLALQRRLQPLFGNALWTEYSDLLGRDVWGKETTHAERIEVLAALASVGRWVRVYFAWRPNLPDEADNHLVELAVAGGAVAIVTHNVRDLSAGELHFEGIETLKPAAFLAKFFGDKQ
jgi:putative PIN family toxin of toxin-antitoxin system